MNVIPKLANCLFMHERNTRKTKTNSPHLTFLKFEKSANKTPNESNDENEWLHVISKVHGLTHGDETLIDFDGLDR